MFCSVSDIPDKKFVRDIFSRCEYQLLLLMILAARKRLLRSVSEQSFGFFDRNYVFLSEVTNYGPDLLKSLKNLALEVIKMV